MREKVRRRRDLTDCGLEAVEPGAQEGEGPPCGSPRFGGGGEKSVVVLWWSEFYRGREYTVDLLPKVKIEAVIADEMVDKAIAAITGAARSGKIGDGKIFLSRIDDAIRIRNSDRGEGAL